jgi:hypothetical protein
MEWSDFFSVWEQHFARQRDLQAQAVCLEAIAEQSAYAALQDGPHTGYVRQAMDRYRRAPNVSQGWLDAMLDIELGLFQP